MFTEAQTLHASFVRNEISIRKFLVGCSSKEEHADAAYAFRETHKLIDDVRKRLEDLRKLSEKMACVIAAATFDADTIRTDYCSATPDVKPIASVPSRSRQPEEYAKLMSWLGVPEGLWSTNDDHAPIKPHWPGVMEMLDREMRAGRPLPPGIDPNKTYNEYKLVIRGKKGVSE